MKKKKNAKRKRKTTEKGVTVIFDERSRIAPSSRD
jgi:hypothetical protein